MKMFNEKNISQLYDTTQEIIMESARLLMYGISPQKK